MFENVDARTGGQTDGRTDDGVTGILLAHPLAFGSGELKITIRHDVSCESSAGSCDWRFKG